MPPVTNRELARKLRIIAQSTKNEKVAHVLKQSADRLEKPGHKQNKHRAITLYSVWDKNDKLIAFELPEKDCLERMDISHSGFMKAIRVGSQKWRIEKRFSDEEPED